MTHMLRSPGYQWLGQYPLFRVLLRNESASELPAWSPCQITGEFEPSGPMGFGFTVEKFSTRFTLNIAASAEFRIPAGKTGPGYIGTMLPMNIESGASSDMNLPILDSFSIEAGDGPLKRIKNSYSPQLFILGTGPINYKFKVKTSLAGVCDILFLDETDTGEDALIDDELVMFDDYNANDIGYCFLQNDAFYAMTGPCAA